ncbi:MAG: PilN domain-containing protein [Humidesulfovibrio sp.]
MSTDSDTENRQACLPEAEHRRYGRILLAITVAGTLFCAGQAVRWWHEHARAVRLEQAVHEVYRRALGGDPGKSPYGRLQFELGKLRAEATQRLDMVELLAALSRRAPEGLRITAVSMAAQDGTVGGTAQSLAELERYLSNLATESLFTFSLTSTDALQTPLRFELSVKARDRAAPPEVDQ